MLVEEGSVSVPFRLSKRTNEDLASISCRRFEVLNGVFDDWPLTTRPTVPSTSLRQLDEVHALKSNQMPHRRGYGEGSADGIPAEVTADPLADSRTTQSFALSNDPADHSERMGSDRRTAKAQGSRRESRIPFRNTTHGKRMTQMGNERQPPRSGRAVAGYGPTLKRSCCATPSQLKGPLHERAPAAKCLASSSAVYGPGHDQVNKTLENGQRDRRGESSEVARADSFGTRSPRRHQRGPV